MFSRLNPFKSNQAQVEMDDHAEQLRRMSEEMLSHYREGLSSKLNDPTRLAEVYGNEFAGAGFKAQAKNVATQAQMMLKVPNAMVSMITATEQVQVAAAVDGAPERIPCQEGFCENVIGTGRAFAVDDSGQHSLVCNAQLAISAHVVSYLGVPVVVSNQIVGVLCVWESRPRHWAVADVSILTQLSTVLARTVLPSDA